MLSAFVELTKELWVMRGPAQLLQVSVVCDGVEQEQVHQVILRDDWYETPVSSGASLSRFPLTSVARESEAEAITQETK